MAGYEQITETSKVAEVYRQMGENFGSGVLESYRMAMGAFLDLAPKLTEHARALSLAMQNQMPGALLERKDDRGEIFRRARSAASFLMSKGISEEAAMDTMEGICHVLHLAVRVRPDYSQGGKIPYEHTASSALSEELAAMNHIRWFLNHEGEYHWNIPGDRVKNLRRLMNRAGQNKEEIEREYRDLTRGLYNDPYAGSILLEEPEKADFTSDTLDGYLVVRQGEPVAIGFAKQFPEVNAQDALSFFEGKKAALREKAKRMRQGMERAASSIYGSPATASRDQNYVILGALLSLVLGGMLYIFGRMSQFPNWFLYVWSRREVPSRIWSDLPLGTGYVNSLLFYSAAGLVEILLVIMVLRVLRRYFRVKSMQKYPERQKRNRDQLFGGQIEGDIALLEQLLFRTWQKKEGSRLAPHDYREALARLQEGTRTVPKGIKKQKFFGEGLLLVLAILGVLAFSFMLLPQGKSNWQGEDGSWYPRFLSVSADEVMQGQSLVVSNYEEYQASQAEPLTIRVAAATSTLVDPSGRYSYSANNIKDMNSMTFWEEGVDGPGIEERLEIAFDEPRMVEYIYIEPGVNLDYENYMLNNRIKAANITVGGETFVVQFEDEYNQSVWLKLTEPVETESVILGIREVYQGDSDQFDDTGVSEFRAYGW